MSTIDRASEPAPERVDITSICRTFPDKPAAEIPRDNVLQLLDTMLDSGLQLLTIEGEEGIGKTTLLAQFAKRHGMACFSMFIRPTSRFAYDPTVLLADICDQMSWFLSGKELSTHGLADEAASRQLILELQRRARHREKFFFVVDGMEQIPKDGPRIQDILKCCPSGSRNLNSFCQVLRKSYLARHGSKSLTNQWLFQDLPWTRPSNSWRTFPWHPS